MGKNLKMSIPLSDPREFLRLIEEHFDSVYVPGTLYRASGFGMYAVTSEQAIMPDLFGESVRVESQSKLIDAMDSLNRKYGKHTLHLGASHVAVTDEDERQKERRKRSRPRVAMPIERKRKTINIPYLGVAH